MKEHTRFCTSMRDNTKFGGLIHLQELSLHIRILLPYHGSHFARKIIADRKFDEQCHPEILFKHKS